MVGLGVSTAFGQTPPASAAPAAAATPKPATLGLAVYPGSGQDATQQGKDESECYAWAHQQTGIDPAAAPAAAPPANAPKGGAVKGAARGAAKGRRAQKKATKEAETQAEQAAQTQDATTKDTFKKAWAACLEGRGYSVK